MNNLPIQTYESVVQQRDALEKKLADVLAENVVLKNSSAYVIQDGEPPKSFYRDEWFIANVKGHGFAVLRSLPEEYSYGYTTLDATYFSKDLIIGWMQLPTSEYLPNVETPVTDALIRVMNEKCVYVSDGPVFGGGHSFDLLTKYLDQLRKGINDAQ
ncbi:hypothetical protein [Hafnia alvei]|uniref:hypothetical protein n=1 Tax=Hafnia alvei TaxID=569 RepID=UPI0011EED933|nr:hypothetical protein [Hafnia alvei]KAA0259900.1 hypothetical protein ERL64_21490 [Hafnia alvei]